MDFDEIQSEDVGELFMALAKAQGEMDKAEKSTQGHRSKFADLESVVDATRPALSDNGLGIAQLITETETSRVLITQMGHESGQWMRSYFRIRAETRTDINENQAEGSAISYARRYCYESMVCASRTEDDDGQKAGPNKQQKPPQQQRQQPNNQQKSEAQKPPDDLKKRALDGYVALARDFPENATVLKDLLEQVGAEDIQAVPQDKLAGLVGEITKLYRSFFDALKVEILDLEFKRGVPQPHIANSRAQWNVSQKWNAGIIGDLKKYKEHQVNVLEAGDGTK